MKATLSSPVDYRLVVGESEIPISDCLNKNIKIIYAGKINCIHCGRETKKSFQQGYCYPCMQRLNECGNCAIFPERCQVEQGTCPEDDWAHAQCASSQIIYLANASGLKVGITRETHVPTRWIDQGAIQAIPIFSASNRYRAGLMEMALKAFVSDRTNWRTMLKNEVEALNLLEERDRLLEEASSKATALLAESEETIIPILDVDPIKITYPVLQYPTKIKSLSLDKTPEVEGCLQGIKGQYLLLDSDVINIRKFGGYEVELLLACDS